MRRVAMASFCFAVVFAVGCGSSKPKDMIVGKWEAAEGKEKEMGMGMEFKPDGVVVMTMAFGPAKINVDGKYKFPSDDIVEIEFEPMKDMPGAKKEAKKAKVEVTKDTLTMTSQDEKKEVMKLKKAAK